MKVEVVENGNHGIIQLGDVFYAYGDEMYYYLAYTGNVHECALICLEPEEDPFAGEVYRNFDYAESTIHAHLSNGLLVHYSKDKYRHRLIIEEN